MKTLLILITNRQYNLIDVLMAMLMIGFIMKGHILIGFFIFILGSIFNALVSFKANQS